MFYPNMSIELCKIKNNNNSASYVLFGYRLFKGVVPTKNLPELKTVINIVINKCKSKVDVNEDSVEPLPVVVAPEIKKSLRIRQKNFRFVNKLQPIVLNNVKKIKTSYPIKVQSCKRSRKNKSKTK